MIIDINEIRTLPFEDQMEARRRVFVDGREILGVWYVDDDPKTGHVRTWDVLGDGRIHTVRELEAAGKMQDDWDNVEISGLHSVASKTLMGRIEIRPYDERKR